MADWRASMSFSERFKWVSELQQTLRLAMPNKPSSEVNALAQSVERRAHDSCQSKQEYENHIKSEIQEQKQQQTSSSDVDNSIWAHPSSPEHHSTEYTSLGKYTSALPHQDGTSSTVYKCPSPTDPKMLLALKLTTPSTQPAPHDCHREARMLFKMRQHPNIIELLETFLLHNHFILVFPFLPWSLDAIIRTSYSSSQVTQAQLPSRRRKTIIKDVISGLAHLHAHGILHRDIKPGNILLSSPLAGPAQLIDFGIAWSSSDPGDEAVDAKILDVGTTSYRAPELLFGNQKYGTPLDMWAAGCVAAEVIMMGKESWKAREGGNMFDAGDLGSELALIKSHFETLGTPTGETWPESKDLPDWGKMRFKEYPATPWDDIMPEAELDEKDFVKRILVYESNRRMTAEEALKHDYLTASL